MRLTTKGRYAVTAMLDLAMHSQHGPITLADISRRQEISLSYLEQLFARLRRNRLVESTRGPGGGYQISRAPNAITVADVIDAVDEQVDATRCQRQGNCQNDARCLTHDLWIDLTDHIQHFLADITLDALIRRQEARAACADDTDGKPMTRKENRP